MKTTHISALLILSALTTGCASTSGWRPVVDPRMDKNPDTVQPVPDYHAK